MVKKLFFIMALMFLAASAFCYTVSEKLALEKDYAERLELVLDNIVGKGKIFVFVSLELDSMQRQEQRETYTSTGEPGKEADAGKKWLFEEKGSQYYLPGFPADKQNPSGFPANMQKIVEQTVDIPGTIIKRADVTIMVDSGVSEETLKPVGRIAGGLLSLSKTRGDTISIKRIPFPPAKSFVEQFKKPELMLDIGKYVLIFILLMAFIFSFLVLSKDFIRNVAIIGQALRPKFDIAVNQRGEEGILRGAGSAPAAMGTAPAAMPSGTAHGAAQAGGAARTTKRFDFINEKNVKRFGVIIKNEPAENIAVAVSYLNPKEASHVLADMEASKRSIVANTLVSPLETSFEEVEKVEKALKNKMEYMIGGNEFMLGVLDFADNDTRETILSDVSQKNPRIADQLRNELFLFSDIVNLSDAEIRRIVDDIDNETLSVALKDAPEEIAGRFLANISAGAQASLKQMIELMGAQPQSRVTDSRNRIVSVVRRLMNEGVVAKKPLAGNRA